MKPTPHQTVIGIVSALVHEDDDALEAIMQDVPRRVARDPIFGSLAAFAAAAVAAIAAVADRDADEILANLALLRADGEG